jgi:hypothetical protein
MIRFALKTWLAGAAFASSVAAANTPQHPVYFDSGQYTALFAQGARRWHLQPWGRGGLALVGPAFGE